jgi:Protein of unknown function (DUF1214)
MLKPWSEYVDGLKPAADVLKSTWKPEDENYRADVYRQIMMNLALSYFAYFQSDPHHPDWIPMLNSVFMLQPNPDDTYYFARIRSDCRYLVGGERGTVHLLTFSVGGGMLGFAEVPGPGSSHFDDRSLQVGPDNRFEVLFSRDKPPGYSGNWAKLESRDDYIWIRQRSYDWGNEKDARVFIECLDAPSQLKPRMTADEIAAGLTMMQGFSKRLSGGFFDWQNSLRDRLGVNKFEFTGFSHWGGVAVQHYWQAIFELRQGEALILETELPQVRPYWNVQLNDPLFNAIEFIYRQSSINGHTAHIDSDGKFRAVISHEDPGVHNWLDPGGYDTGTAIGRWYDCDAQPLPTMRRVRFEDLHNYLPPDTPRCSEAERNKILRTRRIGGQLRRRW